MRSRNLHAAAAAMLLGVTPAMAASESTLYAFTDVSDGGFPVGGLIADANGHFYGTTTSGGTGHNGVVFELSPPASGSGAWTETVLYSFTGGKDGGVPQAALLIDRKGALYGTTYAGGGAGDGVVFRLTPPAKGKTAWTERVLWSFTGGNDGSEPTASLIMDASGNLYGTTNGGGTGVVGTVFELSPPAAGAHGWTENVLYNFTGNNDGGEPYGNVLFGKDGNLYGTTAGYGQYNYGTIFRLVAPTSPGGNWTFGLLHAFANTGDGEVPRDGLIQGPDGTLYGTSAGFDTGYGNVFSLKTDGTGFQTIYTVAGSSSDFTGNGPWRTVAMDAGGALYGATLADGRAASGTVFKLTPPAAGAKKWRASILHSFKPNAAGEFAYTTIVIGNGAIFGTTQGVAGQSGFYPGTVWKITN